MNFDYPRAPLAETYRKYLKMCVAGGKRPEDFLGRNPNKPWEMMLVGFDTWDQSLDLLAPADGGIERVPEVANFLEHCRGRVMIGQTAFMTVSELETVCIHAKKRFATLAEALIYVALTPRVQMANKGFTAPTREELFVNNQRAKVYIHCDSGGVVSGRLIPQEKIAPSDNILVCPAKP